MRYDILSSGINPFVRFAGKQTLRKGSYKGFVYAKDCRLLYFCGRAVMHIKDDEWEVEKNDMIFISPNTPYYVEVIENDCYLSVYNINFDYLFHNSDIERPIPISDKKEGETHQTVRITDMPQLNSHYKINIDNMESYFERLATLYSEKGFYFRSELNAYFTIVLTRALRAVTNQKKGGNIGMVLDYIHSNYGGEISNKALGEKFGYHPNHLNRVFVKSTGCSLHSYIINYRIEKAQVFINSSDLTLTEIAERVGFGSLAQFSKCFKKITGISPTDFKII